MKIIDNFLEKELFTKLQERIMNYGVCWYFAPFTDENIETNDQFYFGHNIYVNHQWSSNLSAAIQPLISKINPLAINMIRANLMTKSEKHIESEFHTDLNRNSPTTEKSNKWTTALYYINDCNGYTRLEDGSIIDSRANRLLTFPSDIKHLGATCTDEKRRVLINLNYIT
jgi:hypothetical protein